LARAPAADIENAAHDAGRLYKNHGTGWEADDRQGDGETGFGLFPFTGLSD
jgi:hypothetical protein